MYIFYLGLPHMTSYNNFTITMPLDPPITVQQIALIVKTETGLASKRWELVSSLVTTLGGLST